MFLRKLRPTYQTTRRHSSEVKPHSQFLKSSDAYKHCSYHPRPCMYVSPSKKIVYKNIFARISSQFVYINLILKISFVCKCFKVVTDRLTSMCTSSGIH
jgi:hypothetical protein